MGLIKVTDLQGKVHEIEIRLGLSLFDLIEDAGIPIRGDCGGNCCCSTCHVYIKHPHEKLDKDLTYRTSDENFMLEEAKSPVIKPSKLCCMIEMTEDLDGLEVVLTEDARPKITYVDYTLDFF